MSMFNFWRKYSSEPWSSEVRSADGSLAITDYNSAFVKGLRAQLGEEIIGVKTDAEVVQLWVDRYNYERETPRLEVVHGEISPEGRVNVKLEWNDAFIRMLRESGIEAPSEDDMVKVYLATVTSKVDRDLAAADDVMLDSDDEPKPLSATNRKPSDGDIEAIIDNMDPAVLRMFEKNIRSRAANRRRKTSSTGPG